MRHVTRSLSLLALATLSLGSSLLGQIPSKERAALIAIYNATGGDHWRHKDNWLGAAGTESTWFGVKVEAGQVVDLDLSDNGLTGSLPAEIGDLAELRVVDLHGVVWWPPAPIIGRWPATNDLTGPLPPQIGSLRKLEVLDLGNNYIPDPIPPEIGLLANLRYLNLESNAVSSLPPEFRNLAALRELNVSFTDISSLAPLEGHAGLEILDISSLSLSQFPPEVSSLTGLTALTCAHNRITTLPDGIESLRNLQALDLSSNRLTELPTAMGSLTSLRVLKLPSNDLQTLPGWIGNLVALDELNLNGNSLDALPEEIGNLRVLRDLRLAYNQLVSLPMHFADLSEVRTLDLSSNSLTEVPSALASLGRLQYLYMEHGELQGPIPSFLGSLSELRVLQLTNNQLTRIPPEIGNLALLEILDLSRNRLEGEIPGSIGGLTNVIKINLADNLLSGPILAAVSELANLKYLLLDRNDLTGPLPPMGNLKQLTHLEIYVNRLEGPIPPGFGSLPNLQTLILGGNRLVGELPADFGGLEDVYLNLSFNGLYTNDPQLEEMLTIKLHDWWTEGQVVAPRNFTVASSTATSARLTWTPVKLMDTGWPIPAYYEIFRSPAEGAPFSLVKKIDGLEVSSVSIPVPVGSTGVRFKIRTVVEPHNHNQKNTVVSDFSPVLASPSTVPPRFYLPFFETGKGSFVGFAVSNLESRTIPLRLSAISESGELMSLRRNPWETQLGSGCQVALLGDEIFDVVANQAPANGWVELVTNTPKIGSFFLAAQSGQLDGATALASPAREFFFNRVYWPSQAIFGSQESQATTWLSIANPANEEITVTFRLEGWEKGLVISADNTPAITIPARGMIYRKVEEIFGETASAADAYIRCSVSGGSGAVGFMLVQLPEALIGVAAQELTGQTSLYSAHVATGPEVLSSLKLSNTSREKRNVVLKISGESGTPLADDVSFTLDPNISRQDEIARWFALTGPESNLVTASLRVVADGPGVIGDVLFGDTAGRYASSLALQGQGTRAAAFGHVVATSELFTGVALFNPNVEPAQVQLEVFTQEGEKRGGTTFQLPPGARTAKLVTELDPAVQGQIGGYILLKSDQPVVAQQLFGDFGLNLLSAVPAVFVEELVP